mmetsp:Transcript_24094/g.42951  ORF Transcript_24094/g.42951 Transcript_24094/m.42951 type:complete len:206 (-) Transcript_24094:1203-1820(-)
MNLVDGPCSFVHQQPSVFTRTRFSLEGVVIAIPWYLLRLPFPFSDHGVASCRCSGLVVVVILVPIPIDPCHFNVERTVQAEVASDAAFGHITIVLHINFHLVVVHRQLLRLRHHHRVFSRPPQERHRYQHGQVQHFPRYRLHPIELPRPRKGTLPGEHDHKSEDADENDEYAHRVGKLSIHGELEALSRRPQVGHNVDQTQIYPD